jgi:hypothetical protein
VLALVCRQAGPGVGHLDLDAPSVGLRHHGHAAVGRGVADRVLDQVEEDALEALGLGACGGQIARDLRPDLDPAGVGLGAHGRNGHAASASAWEAVTDDWQAKVDSWTATDNGPYAPRPYYLRLTKDANPNAGTIYSVGDGGPSDADQRTIVDPSYLELVRLGVKRPDHPTVLNTLQVVDEQLGVDTPNGRFRHRYNFDGYGERADGSAWDTSDPDTGETIGRIWPIFAGERGEYELLAGRSANAHLAAIAGAANEGGMIPEQVWDENPPSGSPGFSRGEGTSRPRRWPGRTHSSCASRGRSTPARPWSARASWAAATAAADRARPAPAPRAGRARPRCAWGTPARRGRAARAAPRRPPRSSRRAGSRPPRGR